MKAGDEIYLAKGSLISFCEVVGFRCYCTELKAGHHHILAVAVEAIRRHIPIKLSRFLKLEK